MTKIASAIFVLALAATCCGCSPPRMNQNPEFFLPPELGARFSQLQAFKGAWWNYVIAEKADPSLCAALRAEKDLERVGCDNGPEDLRGLVGPWLADLPLRVPPPSRGELLAKMNLSLAKASAPLGGDVTSLLREDPLGATLELTQLLSELDPVRLPYRDGYLRLPSGPVAIPVLFGFGRNDTAATRALRDRVTAACGGRCGELTFIGSHFGTEWNERVIRADVKRVSVAGTVLFGLFLGVLLLTGRWTAILVTIPVSLGVAAAGYAVGWLDGSIHGLTVAFGSSLTGIAFDYAFHAFVRDSGARVWHANLVGYLTTVAVFVVLAFSSIPLVREIMIFAFVGVSVATALFYLGTNGLPERFRIAPFGIVPFPLRAAPALLVLCLAVPFASMFTLHPDFSLQNLEQASITQKRLTRELFGAGETIRPVFRVHEGSEAELAREQEFAKREKIRVVNRLTFLPPLAEQAANLAAWKMISCGTGGFGSGLTETQRKFFAPFLDANSCASLGKLRPTTENAYTSALRGGGRWLTTFFPSAGAQEETVRAAFPDAFSIRDLAELFPKRLSHELQWMCPVAFLLTVLIVWFSYGNAGVAFAVFIPWLVGLALAVLGLWVSPDGFGFVSFVGLLMVFGVATDFGVFCANFYLNSQLTRPGIWTALLLASLVSILGFAPLLLADHVVLRQLGEPLVLGAIGILLGTFFVQPWWMKNALGR